MRRILYLLQGFCDEVDDAVQEVFIKVYRAKMPQEEKFLAWFYQLILNVGRDQGRKRRTKFRPHAEAGAHLAGRPPSIRPPRPTDPALREAMSRLSRR